MCRAGWRFLYSVIGSQCKRTPGVGVPVIPYRNGFCIPKRRLPQSRSELCQGESISIWETMAKTSEVTHRSLPATVMTMEHFRDAELEELKVTNPALTDADIDEMFEAPEESLVEQMYAGTLTPHYLNCAYRLNRAFWDDILQSVQIEMTPPDEEEEQAMLKMWEVVYCNDEVWAEIDDVA